MTDTVFYDEMHALASELLGDFGKPATVRMFTTGDIGADGKATRTPTDYAGLAVQTVHKETLDRLNPESDVGFIFKGPTFPQIGWHLIHAGNTWEVKDIVRINPEGDRMIVAIIGAVKP